MLRVYPEVDQDSAAAHDPALRTDETFQLSKWPTLRQWNR